MRFHRELGSIDSASPLRGGEGCCRISIVRGGIYYIIKHCAIVVPLLRHISYPRFKSFF